MAIELIEFSWTEIDNIVRNIFPDLARQLKLLDRNSFSEICPVPVPTSTNCFHPWVTTVENAANLSHQYPTDVAMMKLTGEPFN